MEVMTNEQSIPKNTRPLNVHYISRRNRDIHPNIRYTRPIDRNMFKDIGTSTDNNEDTDNDNAKAIGDDKKAYMYCPN